MFAVSVLFSLIGCIFAIATFSDTIREKLAAMLRETNVPVAVTISKYASETFVIVASLAFLIAVTTAPHSHTALVVIAGFGTIFIPFGWIWTRPGTSPSK